MQHGPPWSKQGKRGRRCRYGRDVIAALAEVWEVSGRLCAKRLQPFMPELVEVLERHGELHLSANGMGEMLQMSAAMIDRRLARALSRLPARGRTTTKPGTLLKSAIPIRTYADWDDALPGFLEMDLVAHCGETTVGEYLYTLSAFDIDPRWYEPVALPNRGQTATLEAIKLVRRRLPFPLRGIDSDSGGVLQELGFPLRQQLRSDPVFSTGFAPGLDSRQDLQNDFCLKLRVELPAPFGH